MSGMLQDVRERARDRVVAARLTSMDRENEKLRTEASMLRAQLQRERDDEADLRDALRASAKGRTVKVRKGSGPLRMLVLAGGAYLLGAKAGRERYGDIVAWVRTQQRRVTGKTEDLGEAIGERADSAMAIADRTASDISTSARKAAEAHRAS
jgi:hypothetical protein